MYVLCTRYLHNYTSVLKLGRANIQTIITIKANIRLYCMVDNTCIDTSIQKAGIPGLYGWVEHKGYISLACFLFIDILHIKWDWILSSKITICSKKKSHFNEKIEKYSLNN